MFRRMLFLQSKQDKLHEFVSLVVHLVLLANASSQSKLVKNVIKKLN